MGLHEVIWYFGALVFIWYAIWYAIALRLIFNFSTRSLVYNRLTKRILKLCCDYGTDIPIHLPQKLILLKLLFGLMDIVVAGPVTRLPVIRFRSED